MNQTAFESLREAGMEEKQAVIIAQHTDMADVLASIDKVEASIVKWLATLVALPVFLLLVALILSVILGSGAVARDWSPVGPAHPFDVTMPAPCGTC